eukprot:1394753-Pyramimonas_sp.AAC.1
MNSSEQVKQNGENTTYFPTVKLKVSLLLCDKVGGGAADRAALEAADAGAGDGRPRLPHLPPRLCVRFGGAESVPPLRPGGGVQTDRPKGGRGPLRGVTRGSTLNHQSALSRIIKQDRRPVIRINKLKITGASSA